MATEREQSLDEDEEVYERPRPRRRFRGLHWRHASQSQTPPPANSTSPQNSPPQIRPLSVSLSQSGFGGFDTTAPNPFVSDGSGQSAINQSSYSYSTNFNSTIGDIALSEDFASELSKAFQIDEDPLVEELESSLREKSEPYLALADCRNQRLSMQTHELERLSQRIKEAEERLRRVEEENEEMSQGPTPPISPNKSLPPLPTNEAEERAEMEHGDDKDFAREVGQGRQ